MQYSPPNSSNRWWMRSAAASRERWIDRTPPPPDLLKKTNTAHLYTRTASNKASYYTRRGSWKLTDTDKKKIIFVVTIIIYSVLGLGYQIILHTDESEIPRLEDCGRCSVCVINHCSSTCCFCFVIIRAPTEVYNIMYNTRVMECDYETKISIPDLDRPTLVL